MKTIVQTVIALVVIVSMTGCASTTGYFVDRGRDAADIVTAGVGVGIGAKARVGPVQTGLLVDVPVAALRGGYFPCKNHGSMFPDSFDLVGIVPGIESFYRQAGGPVETERRKDFEAQGLIVYMATEKDLKTPVPYYYTQVEVVAGLGLSIRLGLNPGELLDFLLGWFGIDIYGDDLEARKQKDKSNQVPESAWSPASKKWLFLNRCG